MRQAKPSIAPRFAQALRPGPGRAIQVAGAPGSIRGGDSKHWRGSWTALCVAQTKQRAEPKAKTRKTGADDRPRFRPCKEDVLFL